MLFHVIFNNRGNLRHQKCLLFFLAASVSMSLKASQLLGITCLGAFQKLPSASNFHSQSLSFSDSAHNTLAPSFSSTIFAHDFNKLRTDSLNCGSAVLKRLRS